MLLSIPFSSEKLLTRFTSEEGYIGFVERLPVVDQMLVFLEMCRGAAQDRTPQYLPLGRLQT